MGALKDTSAKNGSGASSSAATEPLADLPAEVGQYLNRADADILGAYTAIVDATTIALDHAFSGPDEAERTFRTLLKKHNPEIMRRVRAFASARLEYMLMSVLRGATPPELESALAVLVRDARELMGSLLVRVRRCERCGDPFVPAQRGTGWARYCSKACGNRERKERWREKHGSEERQSEEIPA